MSMRNRKLTIFRLDVAADVVKNADNQIDMDATIAALPAYDPDNPTAAVKKIVVDTASNVIGLRTLKRGITRFRTDNSAPYSEATEKPDSGLASVHMEIYLTFTEFVISGGSVVRNPYIRILKNWALAKSTVNNAFPLGRFGMKNEWRPEYDRVPSLQAGYKVSYFEDYTNLAHADVVMGILHLDYSGPGADLIS